MTGLDPRLIVLLCVVFIGLGIFNVIMGRRRLLAAQARGEQLVWYKQTSILIGIEYVLLSLMFLTSVGISNRWFPSSLNSIINPLYLVLLIASAVLAVAVIYLGMTDARRRAAQTVQEPEAETDVQHTKKMTPEERAAYLRKRRERRKKAAEARRRRAGKA